MISLFLALALSVPAATPADTLFSQVKIRSRETVSWLAFRHLGAFDKAIRDSIRKDNPAIADLDRVEVGQCLRLRRSLDRRPLPPERQIAMASRQAVLTTLKGSGDVRHKSGQLEPLVPNMFLAAGDEIQLGAGAVAELVIDNQSILRLRENSRLRLLDIQATAAAKGPKVGTRVALDQGALWVKVRKWAGPLVGFQVRLPSTIAGVHGTIFESTVGPDGSQSVSVREGVVSVSDLDGKHEISVRAGERVSATPEAGIGAVQSESSTPSLWQDDFLEPADDASSLEKKALDEEIRQQQERKTPGVRWECSC